MFKLIAQAHPKCKKVERWGRFKGDEAKVGYLLQNHVLASKLVKKLRKELKASSIDARADAHILSAVGFISSAYRAMVAFRMAVARKAGWVKLLQGSSEEKAALMLQRHLRGLVSKAAFGARRALRVREVHRRRDGQALLVQLRTGVAHWEKPAGLRWNDIGNPVRMPEADTRFEVPCVNCMATCVSCYCAECASLYCADCEGQIHAALVKKESKLREQRRMAGILTFVDPDYDEAKARLRHQHHVIQTEVCAQCGFQIGSKWCTLCKDNYCDTCFDDQHLKGNLQTHQDHFEWTVDACEDCGVRARALPGQRRGARGGRRRLHRRRDAVHEAVRALRAQPARGRARAARARAGRSRASTSCRSRRA